MDGVIDYLIVKTYRLRTESIVTHKTHHHINEPHARLSTYCEQRCPRGAGLIWNVFLSCDDVLEVLPRLFVEDHVEEEDEDSL